MGKAKEIWERQFKQSKIDEEHRRRLTYAAHRLQDAELERQYAIHAANQAGMSLRDIGKAVGLGKSRIQQILKIPPPAQLPGELEVKPRVTDPEQSLREKLLGEAGWIRLAAQWITDLSQRKRVVVVVSGPRERHEAKLFGYLDVVRVLTRVAGDLEHYGAGNDVQDVPDRRRALGIEIPKKALEEVSDLRFRGLQVPNLRRRFPIKKPE